MNNLKKFLFWKKNDWQENFHKMSEFVLEIYTEAGEYSIPLKFYFSDENFGDYLSEVFIKFHKLFVLNDDYDDGDNLFLHPLNNLLVLTINATDLSREFVTKFLKNGCLCLITKCLFENSKFSLERMYKRSSRSKFSCSLTDRIHYISNYLTIISNIIRVENNFGDSFKYDFKMKMTDFIKFLSLNAGNIPKELIVSFKITYFLAGTHLLSGDLNDSIFVSEYLFNVLFKNLSANLIHEPIRSGIIINNYELLEIFMLMAGNENNYLYLIKVLPMIFQFFQKDWCENIQIYAASCIYCIIEIQQCKSMILQNEKFMEILMSPIQRKNKKLEHLRKNILYELKENLDENSSLIVLSYHKNDIEKVNKVAKFLKKTIRHENILFLDSNCNKVFFILSLIIQCFNFTFFY